MAAEPLYAQLMNRRRDRAIAIILGLKEKDIDEYLPKDIQVKFRKLILDQVNDLTSFALDLIRSLDDPNIVPNEVYWDRLEEKIDKVLALYGH